jgi:hypothetical protein
LQQAVGNAGQMGDYLNRVQTAGVPVALQPLFYHLLTTQQMPVYLDQLTEMGADFYAQQNSDALDGAMLFARQMMHCGSPLGDGEGTGRGGCRWAEYRNRRMTASTTPGTPGMTALTQSFFGGVSTRLDSGAQAILSGSVGTGDLHGGNGLWQASASSAQLGLGLRKRIAGTDLGAMLGVGEHSYATIRSVPAVGTRGALGQRGLLAVNAALEALHRFGRGGFGFTPSAELGVSYLHAGASTESNGQDAYDLRLHRTDHSYLWFMPGMALSYSAKIRPGWRLRAFADADWRFQLGRKTTEALASFAADNSGAAPLSATQPLGQSQFIGEIGVQLAGANGLSLTGSYEVERNSAQQRSRMIALKVSYKF